MLTPADSERARSWHLDITARLLPDAQFRDEGNERRFTGNGGLLVNRSSGQWFSHADGRGGSSTLSLVRQLRSTMSREDVDQWIVAFLRANPGTGQCAGSSDDAEGEAAQAASRLSAERVLEEMVRVERTPAETYLRGRGLEPPWPECLGYLADARCGEGALVGVLTAHDRQVGVQIGYLDPDGGKSLVMPQRRQYRLEESRGALFAIRSDSVGPLHIAEGLEDALSVCQTVAGPVWGLPGIGGLAHIEGTRGAEVIVVRDGDEPGSPADKGLTKGLDRLLLHGVQVKVTPTPPEADANGILQSGGAVALRALIAAAKPAELSLDGEALRLARMDPADRDRAISGVAQLHGVKLGTLRPMVAAAVRAENPGPGKQADALIALAGLAELFHAPDGVAFADVTVNDHRETWAVRSRGFKLWLSKRYFEQTKGAPNSEAMTAALAIVEAKALFDAPERPVSVRVGGVSGRIYIDLCNDDWQAIEIDAAGWRVVNDPPVRFRRAKGMLPLPTPTIGGNIETLRRFLNVKSDADFVLVVAFLLACLRDRGPYVVLILSGQHGAAKTTFAAMLRALIDPNTAPMRALPRNDRDLFIAACNAYLLGFDNVSSLPDWLSDTLCRLATGGGFATRQLYADAEEALFDATRPMILNGIEDFVTRADLADRAIFLPLSRIEDQQRQPEEALWAAFEVERPGILGALLDAVAEGLKRLPTTHLEGLPRMADFALWANACEPALWKTGTFNGAYGGNLGQAVLDGIEADPVANAVRGFIEGPVGNKHWTGTATQLLQVLSVHVGDHATRAKGWPTATNAFSGRLRRAAPNLHKIGITIVTVREGNDRTRTITLSSTGDDWVRKTSSASSASSANGPLISKTNGLVGSEVRTIPAPMRTMRTIKAKIANGIVRTNPLKSHETDDADDADDVLQTRSEATVKNPDGAGVSSKPANKVAKTSSASSAPKRQLQKASPRRPTAVGGEHPADPPKRQIQKAIPRRPNGGEAPGTQPYSSDEAAHRSSKTWIRRCASMNPGKPHAWLAKQLGLSSEAVRRALESEDPA